MSRMWRVQRRAFADEQRHTDACASRTTRSATRSAILFTALASKEFRSMVRRPAATQTGRVLHRTDGSYRRLGAFGVQPGRRSGRRSVFHSAAWRMDGRPDRCMAYRARH